MRWILVVVAGLAVSLLVWLVVGMGAPSCEEDDAGCRPDRPVTLPPDPGRAALEVPGEERVPRVLVLAEAEVPPEVPGEPVGQDALVGLHPSKGRSARAADVVRAVSHRIPLRFVRRADLDALEALEDLVLTEDETAEGAVALHRILAHWREGGFETHEMGRALMVLRPENPPAD